MTGDTPGVQALTRGIDLLDALADAGGEAGVSELAGRTGLPPATIHRLVRTLLHRGYLRQLPSRRYALGPALVRIGDSADRLIGRWATPVLAELVDAVGETANVAVLDGDHAVYLAQVPSPHAMRTFTEIGRRVPVHCTGVGKALLSVLPAVRVESILARAGLPGLTPTTITDPDALAADLAATRDRGYARDEGEQEPGVRCVAVAVARPQEPVAISVSGPQSRLDDAAVERIAPLVMAAAERLRAALAG